MQINGCEKTPYALDYYCAEGIKKMNIEHRTSNIEHWSEKEEETEELIQIFIRSIKAAEEKQK